MTPLVEDISQQQKVSLTFQGDCQASAVAGKVRQSRAARKSQQYQFAFKKWERSGRELSLDEKGLPVISLKPLSFLVAVQDLIINNNILKLQDMYDIQLCWLSQELPPKNFVTFLSPPAVFSASASRPE
jgi:hypothetical protein